MPGVAVDTHAIVWYLSVTLDIGSTDRMVADALEFVSRSEVRDLPDRIVAATCDRIPMARIAW